MVHKINALIVANPGRFRDGLQTVVQMMPNILSVACAADLTAVLPLSPISLILLDADLAVQFMDLTLQVDNLTLLFKLPRNYRSVMGNII